MTMPSREHLKRDNSEKDKSDNLKKDSVKHDNLGKMTVLNRRNANKQQPE